MNRRISLFASALLSLLLAAPNPALAEPPAAAITGSNAYIATVESRLAQQHLSPKTFLAAVSFQDAARLQRGEPIIQQLATTTELPGAILHHWRGTAFAPGATAADFERLMQDFPAYPQHYAPQVLQTKVLAHYDDRDRAYFQALLRIRQHHILTVVLDTTYDITFAHLDAQHGYSTSRSTRIAEIDSPGSPYEHALTPAEDHGFLWRQNTYWSYEQRDGGLYLQVESVSLTRSIPRGLGWAVQPFVQSIPRDSLEFTLRSTCNALHK